MNNLQTLNDDFGLNIPEEYIDNLATDVYLEMHEEFGDTSFKLHGFQGSEAIIKYTFSKLVRDQLLIDLIQDQVNNLETDSDAVRILQADQAKKTLLAKGIAKLVALKLAPTAKISETQTAGAGGGSSIESAAPEHTIEVVNGEETKMLQERLELRKRLNEITDEALRLRTLKEKAEDVTSDYNQVRYKLQSFVNGGTPYVDENGVAQIDGEKDGPSSYEAWRAGINSKKRDARLKLENEERNSPFASPKHTTRPDPSTVLDGQADEFLSWYTKKFDV
jgi:hypothetical protein